MKFSKEELPIAQFKLLGVEMQDPTQIPHSALELLLQGKRTIALKFKPAFEGMNNYSGILTARLSLSRDAESKAFLKFHPWSMEPENSFGLTHPQIHELKSNPERPVMIVDDDRLWNVYLDTQTNEMVSLNLESIRAPLTINGQRLTDEQEMRFKLGETIYLSNPDGRETAFRLDPFQNTGITGRNLDWLEIELDGKLVSLPYKGRMLIDNDFLLRQELGGLIILEEALKQRLSETHPDLMVELDRALNEAKEEILHYKVRHDGHINSEEIANILFRHLSSAGIPSLASLESLISSESASFQNNSSDETGEEGSEQIYWLVSSKSIDGASHLMLESAMGATIIGILSVEEREKFTLAIKKVQASMDAGKEVLSPTQLQEKMLDFLREKLGPHLAVYQKDSQLKVSQIPPLQKQQPNISQ